MGRPTDAVRERLFSHRSAVPMDVRDWAKRQPLVRRVVLPRPRWGNLRRDRPFGFRLGLDRGTPIDRPHIEAFLAEHAQDVRGTVLEVKDRTYTERFGGTRVQRSEILDVVEANDAATIVADLAEPGSLPADTFDCVIVTQTLQYVGDPCEAVRNLYGSLREGGVALITVPASGFRVMPGQGDLWRFTPEGLATLLARGLPATEVDRQVEGRGGFLASVGFLYGLAVEDLTPDELTRHDPDFPLIATARFVRRAPSG
jgi:SAM-dependent methyltransferase